jgi:hypothetical protein
MTITMDDKHIASIAQAKEFVKLSTKVEFKSASKEETYEWISEVLGRFKYFGAKTKKKDRGIVLSYITFCTGLSRGQVKKLAKRKRTVGKILRIIGTRNSFARIYGAEDIARLIETDNAHGRIAGEATRRILEREYAVYGDVRYEMISHISVSHLYNLRGTKQYVSHALHLSKTTATSVNIGTRRKPKPDGKPGYLRVDSVHQGDLDKEKGVYHINIVDEVTQWEIVGCVEGISEYFLLPLLEELLALFPFAILNFHSDNGSEYVNKRVAVLLSKLMVDQTKSRSRHSNDNALVEGKNGSRIRKHMGHAHIPRKYARSINAFDRAHMDEYLNFHRPCAFATDTVNAKGKIKKKYETYLTPFEKLRTIPNVETFLNPGVTIASLEEIAKRESDNSSAEKMQKAKKLLFKTFTKC